jgi:hypothetical protein
MMSDGAGQTQPRSRLLRSPFRPAIFEIRDGAYPYRFSTCRRSDPNGRPLGHPICASPSAPPRCRIFSCKLCCTAAKDGGLNIASFGHVLMAFAMVTILGIVSQVDAAGGGPDQKADAMPADPATLATIKGAIALARKGQPAQASDVKERISDPVARKVVEWAILCSDNNEVDFQRYVAFISDNPGWPNIGLLRRRAEAALWKERLDPPTVRAYFDKDQPLTAQGKFALARALLLEGDRAGAQNLVREAWRYDNFSGDLKAQILDVFRDLITDADHKTRMDMRLYAEDVDAAMRSANRAAGNAPVTAIARVAVIKKAADAKAQLDGVPAEARGDIGYIFSRAQWLRREGKATEAAELILSVPDDPTQALDADQWWIERRFVSRTLLDLGDAKTAYRVASAAAVPSRQNYRVEHQFTSGWIALRFLNDAVPRLHTSPRSAKARAIRSRSHAPTIGRAAPRTRSARPMTLGRITRRRRGTPPPITASWHGPGSGSRTL